MQTVLLCNHDNVYERYQWQQQILSPSNFTYTLRGHTVKAYYSKKPFFVMPRIILNLFRCGYCTQKVASFQNM